MGTTIIQVILGNDVAWFGAQIVQLVPVGFPVIASVAVTLGNLVHAVIGRRLQLVPVMHTVIAFELGVMFGRDWGSGAAIVLSVVDVEIVRLILSKGKVEEIGFSLAGAIHVWSITIGAEALRVMRPKLVVWVVSTKRQRGGCHRALSPP